MNVNRERCLVTTEVAGETYRLQLSMNAMCEVEALLSVGGKRVSFNDFLTAFMPAGLYTDLRLVVWAALREHHPAMTIPQAGAWIDQVGWHEATMIAIECIHGTRPDEKDLQALGVPGNAERPPRARQAGTGEPSRSKPGRLASPLESSGISPSANSSASS